MTKTIPLALTAALSFGAVACKSEIQRETQDVEEAREELREER